MPHIRGFSSPCRNFPIFPMTNMDLSDKFQTVIKLIKNIPLIFLTQRECLKNIEKVISQVFQQSGHPTKAEGIEPCPMPSILKHLRYRRYLPFSVIGGKGETRTRSLVVRSHTLCPIELHSHLPSIDLGIYQRI